MKLRWMRRAANDIPEHVRAATARLEARQLSGAKLWSRLRDDKWLLDRLLTELNQSRRRHAPAMMAGTLGHAIADAAQREAARLLSPAWPRYLAGSAVILAAVLIWLQARERQLHRSHPAPSVVAAANLRPYAVIADSDVQVSPDSTDAKLAETLRTSVRGRYSTRAVTAGSPLRADLLADATAFPGLNTRAIATLRVRHADATLAASLPARVTLAIPAADTAIECPDAYLLAFAREPQGPSTATVALPPCGHERLGALLSAPAVTLMWDRRR